MKKAHFLAKGVILFYILLVRPIIPYTHRSGITGRVKGAQRPTYSDCRNVLELGVILRVLRLLLCSENQSRFEKKNISDDAIALFFIFPNVELLLKIGAHLKRTTIGIQNPRRRRSIIELIMLILRVHDSIMPYFLPPRSSQG